MQAFLFFFFPMCACQKGLWSQSFLEETVKTGDKNCGVTGAMNVLWRKLFQKRSVHEFCCLKELITLEKRNTVPQWLKKKKKKKNLKEQNFDGEAHWFGCCKLSSYSNESCDEHVVYFLGIIGMVCRVYHVSALWHYDVISPEPRLLIFVNLYLCTKSIQTLSNMIQKVK